VQLPAAVQRIGGVGLILGPALQAAGTFFWQDGVQGISAAAIGVVSILAWIVGLMATFRSIEVRVPRYAAVGLPIAIYGALAGVTFGVQGMYEELFGVSHDEAVRLLEPHPLAASVVFWLAGPAFPATLFALGVVLARIRVVPVPVGVLICLGAAAFPMSRIPREALIAHLADLLLLLPFLYLGVRMMTVGLTPRSAAVPPLGAPTPRAPVG
jgi:hypothetical protein